MELSTRTTDYVRFTIVNYTTVQEVLDRLGFEFEQVEYGRWRYRKGAFAGGHAIEVFWDGAVEGMGICVSISGEGCRLIEQDDFFDNWREWVKDWLSFGARFSRLDLAIDNPSGEIKFEMVHEAVRNRDYSCRSQTKGYQESTNKRGTGRTLYVGSRSSMTMLRIYDRGFKTKAGHSFLRFEWEFTKERAQAVAEVFANEGWDAAFGCCRAFIDFKSASERHKAQPCLRKAASWWEALISASKHVLNISKDVQESVARSYAWVKRQVSQTLYALTEVQGGAVDWLYDLMQEARTKPNDKAKRLTRMGTVHGQDLSLTFVSGPI